MMKVKKNFERNLGWVLFGFGFLFLIYIFGNLIVTQHLIGKPKLDYNFAFDNIECCMDYDTLSSILGEGEGWIWDPDELRVIKSSYKKSKINDLNPVGNQTIGYFFSNGEYRIFIQGKEITQAYLEFNVWGGSDILKKLEGCVC